MIYVFKLSKDEINYIPFLEISPTQKIFVISGKQKEFMIDGKRLRVSDKSGNEADRSDLIAYFKLAFTNLADRNKLVAYGFNYDLVLEAETRIDFKSFLGTNVLQCLTGDKVLGSGARVIFERNDRQYELRISPVGDPHKLFCHLNIHYNSNTLNFSHLQSYFRKGYVELINFIKAL